MKKSSLVSDVEAMENFYDMLASENIKLTPRPLSICDVDKDGTLINMRELTEEERQTIFIKKNDDKFAADRAQDHIKKINPDFQMGSVKIADGINPKHPIEPPDIMSLTKKFLG